MCYGEHRIAGLDSRHARRLPRFIHGGRVQTPSTENNAIVFVFVSDTEPAGASCNFRAHGRVRPIPPNTGASYATTRIACRSSPYCDWVHLIARASLLPGGETMQGRVP
ncbi:hypothetical protein GY45DRAFT_145773 [Cubamyces sp. BRFM 1775]|nr:hypothetical protein GY45DRAFT_145773 [Cubamyces sp. BRFM 1775]